MTEKEKDIVTWIAQTRPRDLLLTLISNFTSLAIWALIFPPFSSLRLHREAETKNRIKDVVDAAGGRKDEYN